MNPPEFPPTTDADEDGLLCVGGRLSADWVEAAYRRGVFPWPHEDGADRCLAWFAPPRRAVLEFEKLYVSRRLSRRLRSGVYEVSINTRFREVMQHCARRDEPGGYWITDDMINAYSEMHARQTAHSIEVWKDGHLAGGLYGVSMGAYFSAESMFSLATDASKVALVYLVRHFARCGGQLLDTQVATEHSTRMGVTEIARDEFEARLASALQNNNCFSSSVDTSLLLGGDIPLGPC